VSAPLAPKGLQPGGRGLWRSIVEDVAEGMVLTAPELHGLRTACRMVDRADELDRIAHAEGMMVRGSTGQPILHPAVREARQQRTAAAAIVQRIKLGDPQVGTRTMSRRQRMQLADARRERWPRAQA
jgi:hypothetical protein